MTAWFACRRATVTQLCGWQGKTVVCAKDVRVAPCHLYTPLFSAAGKVKRLDALSTPVWHVVTFSAADNTSMNVRTRLVAINFTPPCHLYTPPL
jgi:hypothetical protein